MKKSSANSPELNIEKAPDNKGVYFTIDNIEEIHQSILNSSLDAPVVLTNTLLESPLLSIDMSAHNNADNSFDIEMCLKLSLDSKSKFTTNTVVDAVTPVFSKKKAKKIGYNYYHLTGERGTRFVLGSEPMSDVVWLTTGEALLYDLDDGVSDAELARLAEAPTLNEQTVHDALHDAAGITEVIIAAAHKVAKTTPDEHDVVIKPPKNSLTSRMARAAMQDIDDMTNILEVNVSGVSFENIGGQHKAKQELGGLVFAISHPDLYKKWGTKPPKGVLLHGPPGTGKTLLAKALAAEADARFLQVKASDIGSMWYGESERQVQGIFDYASRNGEKAILYFDEIDSIAPKRENSHEATQKIIGVLLQNIDGIDASDNIMVVASTNRKEAIDSAMLRPGRLDRIVEVALPTLQEREEIFSVHINKAKQIAHESSFGDVDISHLAAKTPKYSGADIAELIRRTLEEKVRLEGKGQTGLPVSTADIIAAIASYEHVQSENKSQKRPIGFLT